MKIQTEFKGRGVVASDMKDNVLYRATNGTNDVCYRKRGSIVYLTGGQNVVPVLQMGTALFIPLSVGESITLIQEAIS